MNPAIVGLSSLAALPLLLAVSTAPLRAQEGTILLRVTDASRALPLSNVQVTVPGEGIQRGTDRNGRVSIALPAGTYEVQLQTIGYRPETVEDVVVTAGEVAPVNGALQAQAIQLEGLRVSTVDRGSIKDIEDVTNTTAVVSQQTIEERPVTTPVQHLRGEIGVDRIQQGAQSENIVLRGFNNIFSGSLHALTDNRLAGVPSLRVNLLHFIPSTDDDLERVEVVLGPGSALYGPNTANGVVHFITKSPLTDQGTTVAIAGAERDFFKAMFRTSHAFGAEGNPDFGLKVSGQFMRGTEWKFFDPTEEQAAENPGLIEAALRAQDFPEDEIERALSRLGQRDFDIERFSGEVRADWKVGDAATWVFQAGLTSADGIELTGIGAGQTQDWQYGYVQSRFTWDRLFAQAYVNTSDAGDSYLVRLGVPLVDKSKLWVGQVQHGFGIGEEMADGQARQDFTYGIDAFLTRPETEGRINGQYEDEDNVEEFGFYLQSETALTDRLDLVAALRADDSSILDDLVWSPRVAAVFKPTENQGIRFSYNRAFSTPTTLNYFLDINAGLVEGQVGELGYFTRALGMGPDGLSFQDADGNLRGVRLPGNLAQLVGLPAGELVEPNTSQMYQIGLAALLAQGAIGQQQFQQLLQAAPALAGIGLNLLDPIDRSVEPFTGTPGQIPDTPPLEETTSETYEVGYTGSGILGGKLGLSADVWYSQRKDFTSPLLVRTPLILLNGQDVAQRLIGVGVDAQTAQAVAAGIAQVPVAVASSANVVSGTADLIASYVNFGEVDLWGWDIGFKAFLTDEWILDGNASWVSDDFFVVREDEEVENVSEITDVNEVLGLNAPDFKGSLTLGFRKESYTAEGRMRYTSEFPVNSADFVGMECLPLSQEIQDTEDLLRPCVESSTLFDLVLGYRIPGSGAQLQLNVQNVFDDGHRSFVGVPEIGRFAMLQLKYSF